MLLKVSSQQTIYDIQTVSLMRGTLILLRTSCQERTAEKTWRPWWMPRTSSTRRRRNHGTAKVPTKVLSTTRVITPTKTKIVEWFSSLRGKELSRISLRSWQHRILYLAALWRRKFPGNFGKGAAFTSNACYSIDLSSCILFLYLYLRNFRIQNFY